MDTMLAYTAHTARLAHLRAALIEVESTLFSLCYGQSIVNRDTDPRSIRYASTLEAVAACFDVVNHEVNHRTAVMD